MGQAFVRGLVALLLCAPLLMPQPGRARAELDRSAVSQLSWELVFGSRPEAEAALEALVERGQPDVVPALILALRHRFHGDPAFLQGFAKLTGTEAGGWFDAMLWQEAHPEVTPHESYRPIKLSLFERLDPDFLQFLEGERSAADQMKIRLEEITWGGVRVDGIPSLDFPKMIAAGQADYLLDGDDVFGIEINGDVRAYPLRIMGWHEMFNEVIGGLPVALAYCTLCGAGILYETRVNGFSEPFVFGSSGFLYRSNKLMFDRQTNSLWNQFTGRPVVGPLVASGIELRVRPVAITSWGRWRARHPETKVLSLETGHQRDYGSGVVYKDYFASDKLMFPAVVRDEQAVKRKDYVFGMIEPGVAKAWPLSAFSGGAVINDNIGARQIVLIGDQATRSVRAYDRGSLAFEPSSDPAVVNGPGGAWQVGEDFLTGPDGTRLPRLAGRLSYWFAWESYWGEKSELYRAAGRQ